MVSFGQELERFWSRQRIKLRPGASDDRLVNFEIKYNIQLPSDLREYLAAVNGFDDSEFWMTDDEVITFLGLDEIKPLGEYWSHEVEGAQSYFVFADYSISAHVYAIRLAASLDHENTVVVVYDSKPLRVVSSFGKFVESYLKRDYAVLFPEPQA
jgi:cell wall assembly regulator SMI1